ncbi:MAG: hypothetical protein QGH60_03505 [Phycisphaerae bacterium]|jgi:hypothetical protein|nr:hypothetical protein [Phycisphaerae bacterium]
MGTTDVKHQTPHQYADKSNRIYNRAWSIFYLCFGFGLGGLIAVWLWMSWSGGGGLLTDLTTGLEWTIDVIFTIVLGYAVIMLVWVGFTAPVFWSEIGEKLVFRKLIGVQISEWSDIEVMTLDEGKGEDTASAAGRKRGANRRLRIALLEDTMELTVAIPPAHYDRIVKVAGEHGFVLVKSESPEAEPEPSDSVPESSIPAPKPSESSPEPLQRLPELPKDSTKPSAGVSRLFDILTAPVESAPETVKRTSKTAKRKSRSSKRASKSSKRSRKRRR